MERLLPLAERYDSIYERITGKGLLIGQHFHDGEVGYQVSSGLFRRGVLISGTLTNAKTIRIEPPLVIEYDEIDEVLNRLEDTLKAMVKAPVTGDVVRVGDGFRRLRRQSPMAEKPDRRRGNVHERTLRNRGAAPQASSLDTGENRRSEDH